jgi:hypothetical protein
MEDLMSADLLSSRVLGFIDSVDSLDESEVSAEERAFLEKGRKISELLVKYFVSTRETVANSKFLEIEQLFQLGHESLAVFLDDRFTRDLVRGVPEYVDRLMKLSRLEGSTPASKVTNVYMREAVRTYVAGLPLASVALCRAALEQALKEGIGYQSTGTFVAMNDLLDEAESANVIRDKTIRCMAREVADRADEVLHEQPTTLSVAFDTLVKLRGVLQHVYEDE